MALALLGIRQPPLVFLAALLPHMAAGAVAQGLGRVLTTVQAMALQATVGMAAAAAVLRAQMFPRTDMQVMGVLVAAAGHVAGSISVKLEEMGGMEAVGVLLNPARVLLLPVPVAALSF